MTDQRLAHFLLHDLDDDWMSLASFAAIVERVTPQDYSMERVAGVIEEFVRRGLMVMGSWSSESGTWASWNASISESMARIEDGYDGEVGYKAADQEQLGRTEVFRGEITAHGKKLLSEWGSPYEKYGDPWEGDEYLAVRGEPPTWIDENHHRESPH